MIKNFEDLKKQLAELADIINAFKSEAVQLRIVELVFAGSAPRRTAEDSTAKRGAKRARRPREKSEDGAQAKAKRAASAARGGPAQVLGELITEGFFKEKRAIGDIVDHLASKKARTFKPNELSTTLTRFVRDDRLKRDRNAERQFEYHV